MQLSPENFFLCSKHCNLIYTFDLSLDTHIDRYDWHNTDRQLSLIHRQTYTDRYTDTERYYLLHSLTNEWLTDILTDILTDRSNWQTFRFAAFFLVGLTRNRGVSKFIEFTLFIEIAVTDRHYTDPDWYN